MNSKKSRTFIIEYKGKFDFHYAYIFRYNILPTSDLNFGSLLVNSRNPGLLSLGTRESLTFIILFIFRYNILPTSDINFGSLLVNSKKSRTFIIENKGEFDFHYAFFFQI